jgi:hypothetical protein
MKKLIPFILSFLIVSSGNYVFAHFASWHVSASTHASSVLSHFAVVDTTLSHDELVAKLQQIGLPATSLHEITYRSAPLFSLIYHFTFEAIYFSAFVGLVYLFQRAFRTNVPNHNHAV